METSFKAIKGNNVPIHAPLIPEPVIPYHCPDARMITAVCQTDASAIKGFLEPTPFEYVDNKFTISIIDFRNSTHGSFLEADTLIPVKYKGIVGAYHLTCFETEDWSVIAGRELWGYPKKLAQINFNETKDKVTASVTRQGKEYINLEFDLKSMLDTPLPEVKEAPHLLIHTVPNADGPGVYSQRILSRANDESRKTIRSTQEGKIEVILRGNAYDPLHELLPMEVIGGRFTHFDFHDYEWCQTLDIIK